jgi:hypothetical protein
MIFMLIETRQVPLVEQGLFSLSYHLNCIIWIVGGFLCNVMSIIIRPVSCVPNVVSVSELTISNSVFSNGNVIFLGIHIYICHVK